MHEQKILLPGFIYLFIPQLQQLKRPNRDH